MGYSKISNQEIQVDELKLEQKVDTSPIVASLDKIHKHLLRHNAVINVPEIKPQITVEPAKPETIVMPHEVAISNNVTDVKMLARAVWFIGAVYLIDIGLRNLKLLESLAW